MYIALGTLCIILSRKKNNEAIKLRTCFNKTQQSHKLVHLKLGPVSIVKMGEKNSASNDVFHSKNRGFLCETLGLRIYQYQMLINGIIARFRISLFGPQGQKSQSLVFFYYIVIHQLFYLLIFLTQITLLAIEIIGPKIKKVLYSIEVFEIRTAPINQKF